MHIFRLWKKHVQSFKKNGIKLYEELCSQGTHCLYIKGEKWLSSQCGKKSEVKKMTKLKWKKWQNKNKIISNPCVLLQTLEKTCAKFQKDWLKIVWEVAMTWYPLSIHLRSENDKVQKEQKSDQKYGKDYMKSTCTSSDYGENMWKVPKRLV